MTRKLITAAIVAAVVAAAILLAGGGGNNDYVVRAIFDNAGFMVLLDQTLWNTSWLLSEGSIFGRLLHTLIGYTERPTALQLIVYVGTLLAMYALMRFARYRPQSRVAAPAE